MIIGQTITLHMHIKMIYEISQVYIKFRRDWGIHMMLEFLWFQFGVQIFGATLVQSLKGEKWGGRGERERKQEEGEKEETEVEREEREKKMIWKAHCSYHLCSPSLVNPWVGDSVSYARTMWHWSNKKCKFLLSIKYIEGVEKTYLPYLSIALRYLPHRRSSDSRGHLKAQVLINQLGASRQCDACSSQCPAGTVDAQGWVTSLGWGLVKRFVLYPWGWSRGPRCECWVLNKQEIFFNSVGYQPWDIITPPPECE